MKKLTNKTSKQPLTTKQVIENNNKNIIARKKICNLHTTQIIKYYTYT